jgi:hypothetical protein
MWVHDDGTVCEHGGPAPGTWHCHDGIPLSVWVQP